MSPVEPGRAQRIALEREIEENRRWERRLPWYGLIAISVLVVIVVIRVVFFP